MSFIVGLGGRKVKGPLLEEPGGGDEEENFPPIGFSFSSMEGLWEASDAAAILAGGGAEGGIFGSFFSFQPGEKKKKKRRGRRSRGEVWAGGSRSEIDGCSNGTG